MAGAGDAKLLGRALELWHTHMVHAAGFDPDKRSFIAYSAQHSPRGRWSPSGDRLAARPYYSRHDTRQLRAHEAFRGNTFQFVDEHSVPHKFHPGVAVKEPKRGSSVFMSSQPRFDHRGMRELHPEERMGSVLRKTLSAKHLTTSADLSLSSPHSVGRGHGSPFLRNQRLGGASSVDGLSSTMSLRAAGMRHVGSRPITPAQPFALKTPPSSRPPSRSAAESMPSFLRPELQHDTFFRPRV